MRAGRPSGAPRRSAGPAGEMGAPSRPTSHGTSLGLSTSGIFKYQPLYNYFHQSRSNIGKFKTTNAVKPI